jgi:lysozyme
MKGIDVSKNNGTVNWDAIKSAGYEFAMIRLGVGSDIISQDDPQFERNVSECERLDIKWGVYLYSYALNTADALSEANHALRLLKGKKPSLPVAFDMEDADGYKAKHGMPSNYTLVAICKTFLSNVETAGYYVSLYASLSWLNNQLNSPLLDTYDKWVAQWSDKCTYSKPHGMWQYTDRAVIGGKWFDANIICKDFNAAIVQAGINGWPKPEEVRDVPRPKLNWEQILDKCSNNPADWKNTINVVVNAANAEGDMGPLEILKFLPALLEKAYND